MVMEFSDIEKRDLLKGWVAISIAFGILLSDSLSIIEFVPNFIISLFTVGLAFLLHELGHKYVAQKYHCWAEFRSFDNMLILAIIMSFFGFIFAAPGAVMISGIITKNKNGKISAAGPLVNIVLAVMFFGLLQLGILVKLTFIGFYINALIALFNMIPVWNFDGSKILKWNKIVYGVMVAVSLSFVVLATML